MLKEYLTSIADSIRAKLGTTEKINARDYADKISEVYDVGYANGAEENSGGGAELARSIVDGTITEYLDDEVTSIRKYAFYCNESISNVHVANAKNIDTYAFYTCSSLKSVIGDKVTNLNGERQFYECKGLSEVVFPQLTSIDGGYNFYNCYALRKIDFPEVTTINSSYAFCNCVFVKEINLPKLVDLGSKLYVFYGLTNLTSVNLPSLEQGGYYGFRKCDKLPLVDLPKMITISSYCFYECSALNTLILRKSDAICTLSNTNAFTSTPIASGTGYIYVPSALIDTYKSATNWSTYAAQFRALEDYTVDGTITGELDESKI